MRKRIAIAALLIVGVLSFGKSQAFASVSYDSGTGDITISPDFGGSLVWVATSSSFQTYSDYANDYLTKGGYSADPVVFSAPAYPMYFYVCENSLGHYYDPCLGTYAPYGVDWYWSGSGVSQVASTSQTRILDMQPANGSTTPSNSVFFRLSAYISDSDAGRGVGVRVYLHNIDQNVLSAASSLSPSDIVLYNQAVSTAGVFDYSTTTSLGTGNYRLYAKLTGTAADVLGYSFLTGCTLVGGFLNLVCTEASTQFIVVEPTFLGNLSQSSYAALHDLYASTTATSTAQLAKQCVPWSGGFDTVGCLAFLFVPDSGMLFDSMNNFRDNVSTHFPVGYLTDIITILSTTTEGTLAAINATLPSGVAGAGASIHLDITHSLDYILNATTSQFLNASASSTQTFYQITSYYWNLVVYVLTVLYILGRIVGSHIVPNISSRFRYKENQ